ncbi:MAG TPA: glutamate mutase L [Solirubrobacterales bacterium]
MGIVSLADFGSTFTKVRLVDTAEGRLLARAEAPTSTGSDLMEGYAAALGAARSEAGSAAAIEHELAASSAGGGMRVAAVGLVEDLTAAAARQTALNAGARVQTVVAGALSEEALDELQAARPEIVLFAGGTDGGQAELVVENARRLASRRIGGHAVVACNAEVAEEAAELLRAAGAVAAVAANVMPELGRLEIEPAREAILRVFLEHVLGGKGLSASVEFERMVRMPTPEAVLRATHLLARGAATHSGVGDVVVVDIGGATTDVHSDRAVEAVSPGIEDPILPPPARLRTVEGDLGMRIGAAGIQAADARWLGEECGGDDEAIRQAVSIRSKDPSWLSGEDGAVRFDRLLAVSCATHALSRHSGTMVLRRAENGPPALARSGPDLREVKQVWGTGGVFAHRVDGGQILREALARQPSRSLAPRDPLVCVDDRYVLAAAGLLSAHDPEAAMRLLRVELLESGVGHRDQEA